MMINKVDDYRFDSYEESVDIAKKLAHHLMTESPSNAVGLSANQIGLDVRALIIKSTPLIVMFNPNIVAVSDNQVTLEEGSISYPNVIVKVKRPSIIRVRYSQPNGNVVTEKFEGLSARIIQNLIDHLDGIPFYNRANRIHREKALKKAKKP